MKKENSMKGLRDMTPPLLRRRRVYVRAAVYTVRRLNDYCLVSDNKCRSFVPAWLMID